MWESLLMTLNSRFFFATQYSIHLQQRNLQTRRYSRSEFLLYPLLADTFMGKLESTGFKGFLDNSISYERYVDDIFCIADEELNMEKILGVLNSAHSNIIFRE